MKFSLHIIPLLLFYIAFMVVGWSLTTAAVVLTVSSVACYLYRWHIEKKHNRIDAYILCIITAFTIITILLKNDKIFQWKPTALFGLFSFILLINHIVNRKSIIAYLMAENIKLPDQIWLHVDKAFCAFFFAMAILNAYILLNYTQAVWVNFKMFGILGLTFIFMFGLAMYISRHADEAETS